MALKFKVKSKEEIPAEHAALYAEREGAWVLDVDGAVDKSKLDGFHRRMLFPHSSTGFQGRALT